MVEYEQLVTRASGVAPLRVMPARCRRDWVRLAGRDVPAILVVPCRPDTQWYRIATPGALVCQLTGRVRFPGQSHGAPFPTALIYHGPSPRMFFDAFSPLGDIFRRLPAPLALDHERNFDHA